MRSLIPKIVLVIFLLTLFSSCGFVKMDSRPTYYVVDPDSSRRRPGWGPCPADPPTVRYPYPAKLPEQKPLPVTYPAVKPMPAQQRRPTNYKLPLNRKRTFVQTTKHRRSRN